MRPGRSLIKIVPSEAKSSAHGVSKPRTKVSIARSGEAVFDGAGKLMPTTTVTIKKSRSMLIAIRVLMRRWQAKAVAGECKSLIV